jgi:hypothetical protein
LQWLPFHGKTFFYSLPGGNDSQSMPPPAAVAWTGIFRSNLQCFLKGVVAVQTILDFTSSWYFIGTLLFLLVALGGFLAYRLMFAKKEDE